LAWPTQVPGCLAGLRAAAACRSQRSTDGAGARSEVSPLVAAVLIVVTLLLLTPLFKDLPEAVLRRADHPRGIAPDEGCRVQRYYRERRAEFWLGMATLVASSPSTCWRLAIGVVSMLLLVTYQASRPHVRGPGAPAGQPGGVLRDQAHPDIQRIPGLLVLRLDGQLSYTNAAPVARDHQTSDASASRRRRR